MRPLKAGLPIACVALAALIGACGEGGVGEGATVKVYVSVPLHGARAAAGRRVCGEAQHELVRSGGHAAGVRVRAVCLDDTGGARRWGLAAVGANARRATEDSTAVAYIGELDRTATRFSRSIVEAAGIAQLSGLSGRAAMADVLGAIGQAGGSESLRDAVREELSGR